MNQQNYQKQLEQIIETQKEHIPTLFLHSCCAPCSSYVLEYLSKHFFITLDFYNPNILSKEEFDKRLSELTRMVQEMGLSDNIRIVSTKYDHTEFLNAARGLEQEPERGARCTECFRLRLEQAARLASEGGYDYFCTTLTISPLKNTSLLNQIGEEMGRKYNVKFLPSDFKKKGGYQRSIELSHQYQLYRQNYCGCEFSFAQSNPSV